MHTIFSPTVSPDSPGYLGRLVISCSRVYTVVRTRQSYGRPELFIATPEGQDERPYGQWVPAHVIAEPYRTIIHWHPNTEFREDQSSCEACTSPFYRPMRFAPRSRPRRIRSAASGRAGARPSGRNTRRNGPRATSSPSCARMRATS